MSLLANLKTILGTLNVPNETGVYKATPAPDQFCVLVPLSSVFHYADNYPVEDVQSVRISVFSKTSYTTLVNNIVKKALDEGYFISNRRYIGHEDDTGYHHYAIDIENNYSYEEEE